MELQRKENTERPTSRTPKPFQRAPMSALPSRAKGGTGEKEDKLLTMVVGPLPRLQTPKPRKYILYGQLVALHELVISAIIKRWTGFKSAYARGRGWTVPMDEAILFERLYRQIRGAGLQHLLRVTDERSISEPWPALENNEETDEEDDAKEYVDQRERSEDEPKVTSVSMVPVRPMRRPKPQKNPWVFIVNGQRTTGAELAICGIIYNWDLLKRASLTYWGQKEPLEKVTFHLGEVPMLQATLDTVRKDPRYANVDTPAQGSPLEDTLLQFYLPAAKLNTKVKVHVSKWRDDGAKMN